MFLASRRRQTSCSREWSSDVCSSDLELARKALAQLVGDGRRRGGRGPGRAHPAPADERDAEPAQLDGGEGGRERVVEGKRVDLGGRRILKKKTTTLQAVRVASYRIGI